MKNRLQELLAVGGTGYGGQVRPNLAAMIFDAMAFGASDRRIEKHAAARGHVAACRDDPAPVVIRARNLGLLRIERKLQLFGERPVARAEGI